MIALMAPVSHLLHHNRVFGTTRRAIGPPSGPCVTVLSMAPPSGAMNNVHSGLANTMIGISTLTTIKTPWKAARLDPRGFLHAILQITLQEMVIDCGDLKTNHTIALCVREAYIRLNRVDAGTTPGQPISVIPFLGMLPLRRRRKTGGRGQRTHTPHQDRRRGRRSLRVDQPWETQQVSTQHIFIPSNLLRNLSPLRRQQREPMEGAKKETLVRGKETGTELHLGRSISIINSDGHTSPER